MADAQSISLKPEDCESDQSSELGSQILSLKKSIPTSSASASTAPESEIGEAAEGSQIGRSDLESHEVTEECARSVRFNPLGTLVRVPQDRKAMMARESEPKNTSAFTYDKKRKEMVQEVIYKQGGYIINIKDKETRIKIEPGTPIPPPLKKKPPPPPPEEKDVP